MANFDQLKQSVAALIRTNGAEEITGQIMQDVLLTIINSISGGYMFGGVAQHSGNVGNPDYNVFYLAGSGSYTGYGGAITIEAGCYGVFRYNGVWTQEVVDIGVRLSGSIAEGETRGVTGDVINTALQQLFNNVMDILDTLTFTYNTPSAQQATKAMLDVIMTPTGGAPHVLTTLTLASATVAAAGLMSAEDKQKVDRMLTDFRSLSFSDTTAAADQATKIVQTLSATLGENPEAITTMTFLAATASKAGLMSAADKAVLDCLVAMLGYYECSTAAGTAAKVVSASGYSLTSGGCIRIKMTNANTADNVTLNINSTGAKALYYDGAQASSTNTWEAGEVLEVYYDGTQYQCASGGGGKFATGEKVKDTSITDEVVAGSAALPTSDAVSTAILDGSSFGEKELPMPTHEINYILDAQGTYSGSSYSRRKIIPVEPNATIKITANVTYDTRSAFLTDTDIDAASGSNASLTSDGGIYEIAKNSIVYLKAPSDAKYLVVNTSMGTNNPSRYYINPSSISMMLDMAYLNGELERMGEPYHTDTAAVDLSSFVTKTYNFTSDGYYGGTGGNHNYWLDVVAGNVYTITAGDSSINIGWLKSKTNPVVNRQADLSLYDGLVRVLAANESITLTAPQDAVVLIASVVPASVSVVTQWTYKQQIVKNEEDIEGLRDDVDMLKVPLVDIIIPSTTYQYNLNTAGRYGGYGSYRHVYIPVNAGEVIRITGGNYSNVCAFLTKSDGSPVNGSYASVTSDGKTYPIGIGETIEITAPSDAMFLCINTITASGDATPSVIGEVLPLDEYLTREKTPESIFDFNPDWEYRNKILQAKRKYNLNGSGTSGVVPLVLLHCSDVHSDKKSWDRMMQFYDKYREYIDFGIATGDMVLATIDSDKSYLANGADKVMIALGNHDVAKTSWNVYDTTALECYNAFMAPYIENWGVTYEVGKCYYYKDFDTQKIRFIVLDTSIAANSSGEHWNDTQLAWLQSTLESARTSGYSVIIAQHYWAVNSSGRTYVDCTFTCKTPLSEGEAIIPSAAREAVQAFIDAGGTFICWLSGHTHRDFVYYPTANPKQLGIVVDCTSGYLGNPISVCDEDRQAGTKSIDAFNIISFDTTRKVIKIVRIGSDTDSLMRHKGVLSIQYGGNTPEVIFNN